MRSRAQLAFPSYGIVTEPYMDTVLLFAITIASVFVCFVLWNIYRSLEMLAENFNDFLENWLNVHEEQIDVKAQQEIERQVQGIDDASDDLRDLATRANRIQELRGAGLDYGALAVDALNRATKEAVDQVGE